MACDSGRGLGSSKTPADQAHHVRVHGSFSSASAPAFAQFQLAVTGLSVAATDTSWERSRDGHRISGLSWGFPAMSFMRCHLDWRFSVLQGCAIAAFILLDAPVVSASDLFVHDDSAHAAVFIDGERVSPPFVFMGIDSDTLRLNGIPIMPRRKRHYVEAGDESPQGSSPKSMASQDSTRTLLNERFAEIRATAKAAISQEETRIGSSISENAKAEVVAGAIATLPFVQSAEAKDGTVTYRLVTGPRKYRLVYRPSSEPSAGTSNPIAGASSRQRTAERYASVIRKGGFIAIGHDYDLQANSDWATVTRQDIEILRAMLSQGANFVPQPNSALIHSGFRRDVLGVFRAGR